MAGSWSWAKAFSVSSQAVSTANTSSCSGSLKISWKSDAKARAVTTAFGAARRERGAAGRRDAAVAAGLDQQRRHASSAAPARAPPARRRRRSGPGAARCGRAPADRRDRRRPPPGRARSSRLRGRCRRRGSAASGASVASKAACTAFMPMSSAGEDITSASTSRCHAGARRSARRRRSGRRPARRGCGRGGPAGRAPRAHGVDDRREVGEQVVVGRDAAARARRSAVAALVVADDVQPPRSGAARRARSGRRARPGRAR